MRIPGTVLTLVAFLFCVPVAADAQGMFKRPIRLLVGSPPGGPSDIQARLVVPRMSELLGQTIIVDNRPSNNGIVANEIAAHATPDGYTLVVGNSGSQAVNQVLYKALPYDVLRDFMPISEFSTTGLVVAANPRLPANTLKELVSYAKKAPGKVNIGIAGATGQLAGDALWAELGIKMNNINYKGSAPTEVALLSGEVDIVFLTPAVSVRHLATGKLKALAMTSAQRHPLLPNLPTAQEQGVAGYDFQFWNGMFAPIRTPRAVVQELNKALVASLRSPEVTQRMTDLGLLVVANTPEEYRGVVRADVERYRKVMVENNIERI